MTLNEREEVDLLPGPDDTKNDPQNISQLTAKVWGKKLVQSTKLNGKYKIVKMTWKILVYGYFMSFNEQSIVFYPFLPMK